MTNRAVFVFFAFVLFSHLPSLSFAQSLKPDLMYCGSASTGGSNLYLGVGPFNEVTGCTPNADTQALLITRYGSISGNGAAWLAYLNAGGVIITEYSISHTVYNEIYGVGYAQGTRFGSCSDNTMPSQKLNPGSEFWQVNSGLTETPAGQEGCGYDLTAIVNGEDEVVALGGLVNTSYISLAARQQGSGMLWLLDIDWQDGQENFSEMSKYLMGVLIGGGTYAFVGSPEVPVPALSTLGLLLLLLGLVYFGRRRIRA
ncbi:MAG: hypothetical protein WBS20_11870 [Lysobacterales bacterium]